MSYDRIWIERSEQPEGLLEHSQADKMGLRNEFNAAWDRLYKQGHFVVLSAGKNFAFDELFLFEDIAHATAFYESGFSAWERFFEDEDEGCGFQEVSLYRAGRRVVSKSCAPSRRIEEKRK